MATFNEKTGEIELTDEDRDMMSRSKKLDVNKVMNWIIWGNPEGTFNLKNNDKTNA